MPLTSGRGWSGLTPLTALPSADAPPLSAAQTAVALSFINWRTQSLLSSDDPPIRHFIAGILVEAALRDPPLPVWAYMLAKQVVKDHPEKTEAQDAHARVDALRPHLDLMEKRGDVTTHIDRNRRRIIEATPQLIARVRRVTELQIRMLRAMVLAVDWLEEHEAAGMLEGGPLTAMDGGATVTGPEVGDASGVEGYTTTGNVA